MTSVASGATDLTVCRSLSRAARWPAGSAGFDRARMDVGVAVRRVRDPDPVREPTPVVDAFPTVSGQDGPREGRWQDLGGKAIASETRREQDDEGHRPQTGSHAVSVRQ